MPTIPVETEVVDMTTGDVKERRTTPFTLVPPRSDACPICARYPAHHATEPHDQQSLYYQYSFYAEHGRWPTWKDAIAHCTAEVRAAWEDALRKGGHWTEPDNER